MLPAKDLAYPGAVQSTREFTPAESGRTVDGTKLDRPATLGTNYKLSGPIDFQAVRTWYRTELSKQGWSVERDNNAESSLTMKTIANGFNHRLIVGTIGGANGVLQTTYEIRPAS